MLESYVTKVMDREAALKFLRKSMKRFGNPKIILSDKLRSCRAAMKVIGNADRQETGRWLNNRAENSHLPFRRRERAMQRFRRMRSLLKFVAVHARRHHLCCSQPQLGPMCSKAGRFVQGVWFKWRFRSASIRPLLLQQAVPARSSASRLVHGSEKIGSAPVPEWLCHLCDP